jgi:phage gp36-like protein
MTYATKQNLIDRFGSDELIQRTDRANTGSINDAVINQALSDADNTINSYITAYLPLSTVPSGLVRIACDIARYYLYDDAIPEAVEKRYDDAISYLASVGKGQIALIADSVQQPVTASSVDIDSSVSEFGANSSGW